MANADTSGRNCHRRREGKKPAQKEKISGTLALVRESVESEIGGKGNGTVKTVAPVRQKSPREQKQVTEPASNKQAKYLYDLAREAGLKIDSIAKKFN